MIYCKVIVVGNIRAWTQTSSKTHLDGLAAKWHFFFKKSVNVLRNICLVAVNEFTNICTIYVFKKICADMKTCSKIFVRIHDFSAYHFGQVWLFNTGKI